MNLNRIINMVIALILRRFINMGISKVFSLFSGRNRAPSSSPPLTSASGQADARFARQALPDTGHPTTAATASGVRTSPAPTPEARAARRARQLARQATRRSNGS
jgi:hypothetical protein